MAERAAHPADPAPAAPVFPIPTPATAAFLARPVVHFRRSARAILRAERLGLYGAQVERRRRIEAALERLEDLRLALIAKIDAMDVDPDLESSLGWPEAPDGCAPELGATDDREADDCDLEPNGDYEPSLGSVDSLDQRTWAIGGQADLEDEHDGREPEPGDLCAWPSGDVDQRSWAALRSGCAAGSAAYADAGAV